jgi:hypothetical protein
LLAEIDLVNERFNGKISRVPLFHLHACSSIPIFSRLISISSKRVRVSHFLFFPFSIIIIIVIITFFFFQFSLISYGTFWILVFASYRCVIEARNWRRREEIGIVCFVLCMIVVGLLRWKIWLGFSFLFWDWLWWNQEDERF